MIVKIQVTQADIDHGKRGDCQHCPVARALARTFRETYISAGPVDTGIAGYTVYMPKVVGEFMAHFDSDHKVEPFEFDLDVPDELTRAGTS